MSMLLFSRVYNPKNDSDVKDLISTVKSLKITENKEKIEWRKSITGDIQPNGVSLFQIRIEMSSIYQCQ